MTDAITLDTRPDLCQTGTITDAETRAPCDSIGETGCLIKLHGGKRAGAGRKPKQIPAIPVETTRWYCIRTAPQAESNVNDAAIEAGFETFHPRLWVAPVTARRTATGRAVPAKPERLVPLFPRYIFARFNRETDPWRRLASIRGVECVFGSSPERPTPVPDGSIETIRGQCRGDVVYPDGIAPTSQPAVKRRWTSFMSALHTMMGGG